MHKFLMNKDECFVKLIIINCNYNLNCIFLKFNIKYFIIINIYMEYIYLQKFKNIILLMRKQFKLFDSQQQIKIY